MIQEQVAQHVKFLADNYPDKFEEICEMSIKKLFQKIDDEDVERFSEEIEADYGAFDSQLNSLSYVFTEFAKEDPAPKAFKKQLDKAKIHEESQQIIWQQLRTNIYVLRDILMQEDKTNVDGKANFQSLEWRLDLQLATRAAQTSIKPKIILKLNLKDNVHFMQCDFSSFKNFAYQIDLANRALDSSYAKKVYKLTG